MVRDLFINAIRGQKIKDLVPIKQHMYTLFLQRWILNKNGTTYEK